MRETLERELKLRAPDGFALPELGGEPLESRVFVSTYHDTDDLGLARGGATLRHRVENGRGLWQLKVPRADARLELESGGGPIHVPGEMLALLPALMRGRELVPVARLRTRRAGVRVADGASAAEVVIDSVSVLDGSRVTLAWEEIEVELLEGDPRLLRRIGKELREAGADEPEARPKVVQALGLDLDPEADVGADTAVGALRALLRAQLRQLQRHDPGVRLGGDSEDVHQMRVATRRSRAFLRAARPLLDREWEQALQAELRWLGGELGPVRDHDVLLDHLRGEADALDDADRTALAGLFDRIDEEGAAARAELLDALDGERYFAVLDLLAAAAASPGVVDPDQPLAGLWRREWRRLRRAVGELGEEPPDDDLHAIRILVKRARYAAELATPALGRRGERFVGRAKDIQDVLGDHQDATVAEERLRGLLRGTRAKSTAFAAGRLVERQRARRAAARAAFPQAWAELERAGKRAGEGSGG